MSEFLVIAGVVVPAITTLVAVLVLGVQVHALKERTGDDDGYLTVIKKRMWRHG